MNIKTYFSRIKEELTAVSEYDSLIKETKLYHTIFAVATVLFYILQSLIALFLAIFTILFFAITIVTGVIIIRKKAAREELKLKEKKKWDEEIGRIALMPEDKQKQELENPTNAIWMSLSLTEREEKRKYIENAIKEQKEKAERRAEAEKKEAERRAEEQRKAEEERKIKKAEFKKEFDRIVKNTKSMSEGTPIADLTDDECYIYALIKEHITDFVAPATVRLVKPYCVYSNYEKLSLKSDYAVEIVASNRGGGTSTSIYAQESYDDFVNISKDVGSVYRCYERPSVNVGRVNKAIMYYIKEQGWD